MSVGGKRRRELEEKGKQKKKGNEGKRERFRGMSFRWSLLTVWAQFFPPLKKVEGAEEVVLALLGL